MPGVKIWEAQFCNIRQFSLIFEKIQEGTNIFFFDFVIMWDEFHFFFWHRYYYIFCFATAIWMLLGGFGPLSLCNPNKHIKEQHCKARIEIFGQNG